MPSLDCHSIEGTCSPQTLHTAARQCLVFVSWRSRTIISLNFMVSSRCRTMVYGFWTWILLALSRRYATLSLILSDVCDDTGGIGVFIPFQSKLFPTLSSFFLCYSLIGLASGMDTRTIVTHPFSLSPRAMAHHKQPE